MNDKAKPRNFMMKPDEQPPFAELMGMKILEVTPEKVTAEIRVTNNLTNRNGVMHGGAVMAFADTLGAIATIANLAEGVGTTTIESKTNFFAAILAGDTAKAISAPPCSTPLRLVRFSVTGSSAVTRSGETCVIFMPMKSANGGCWSGFIMKLRGVALSFMSSGLPQSIAAPQAIPW